MADYPHRKLEGKAFLFTILTTIGISIGGLVEIVPMFTVGHGTHGDIQIDPYTPLEVAGRDIYTREGCYLCHSQMVRPFRAETLRYGEWSRSWEYAWDRPFLLGSRRMGPDLHRVGGKYPDAWHYEHMRDPRSTSPGSVMPQYTWLHEWQYDVDDVKASLTALQALGTPYTDAQIQTAGDSMAAQAEGIVSRLSEAGIETQPDREIVALIAYLQRLGTDSKKHLSQAGDGADADGLALGDEVAR